MKIMKTHVIFHIQQTWWKLLLFYLFISSVMMLNSMKIFEANTIIMYLSLFFVILSLYFCLYFYKLYHTSKTRWFLTSQNRKAYVYADVLFVLLAIVLFNVIYCSVSYWSFVHWYSYFKADISSSETNELFLQMIESHSVLSLLYPITLRVGVIVLCMLIKVSSFIVCVTMTIMKRHITFTNKAYLVISLLLTMFLIICDNISFQIIPYSLWIYWDIRYACKSWEPSEIGG